MKKTKIYFLFFILAIVLIFGLQIIRIIYFPSESFNEQVENHLVSIVNIKGEKINDYFLERDRDIRVLANSVEVKELLQDEVDNKDDIIGKNIEKNLYIVSEQIRIYVEKYPNINFDEWVNDEDFLKVAEKRIGKNGFIKIIDYNNFNKKDFDYYRDIGIVTNDGINLGIAAKVDFNEFRILKNSNTKLTSSMRMFKEISNYENLILIDRDGYVIYEVEDGSELGVNLKLDNYMNSFLGKAFIELGIRNNTVYGPYLEIGKDNAKIFFLSKVFFKNEFIGIIVLEDSMKDVDRIVLEKFGWEESWNSYIVDKEKFLITPTRDEGYNLFVQQVKGEHIKKCFENNVDLVSYFINFEGVDVIGSYVKINKFEWCLVADVSYEEIFNTSKKNVVGRNLIFIAMLCLILLLWGWFVGRKYEK